MKRIAPYIEHVATETEDEKIAEAERLNMKDAVIPWQKIAKVGYRCEASAL